ncbi:LarC family nickel insertion protein, partial [Candidatus Woesearchaeota archaeon]|nr:LarC family nickel insertion protein [Candidatus Woesearchaeota archaeon]
VPAPATAELLKNVPVYHNNTEAELVTPTGAAIITTLADKFGEMPAMKVEKIGYGAGTKDLEQPNVLRVFLGELENKGDEAINVIETNIDNMNPEIYPYVVDKLMENGALDACLTSITMKKGRPAVKLTVLSDINNTDKLCDIIFDETTTLGLRIYPAQRKKLDREIKTVKTKYGNVKVKISSLNGKIQNIMPEYEDCSRIAKKYKIPLKKVINVTLQRAKR